MVCVLICKIDIYKTLTVPHHGDNNFLFCFDISIKFTFNNICNDEEMITSHLRCVINQLFYDKNIIEKDNYLGKTSHITKLFLHSKIYYTKWFKRMKEFRNYLPSVNLSLSCAHFQKQPFINVFQNRCSWKFYNIRMQKPVLKPVFIKVAGLLLLKTYDVCFWIFLAANFFQPNLVFIADSRTGFFFQTSLKTRVKTHKQPQELFCKNGVLRSFANFTGKYQWPSTLLKRDSNTDVFLWNLRNI